MKKSVFITALLIAATALPGMAQVIDIPSLNTDATIIRGLKSGSYLLYVHNPTGNSHICLTSSAPTVYFDLPTNYYINDIEVRGDIAYFCGGTTVATTFSRGLYGYFSISDVFYNSGSVNYFICNPPTISSSLEFNKLDVFYFSGRPQLALIAEMMLPTGEPFTVVASANDIGSIVNFEYATNNQINYTDICCLNDMVVAVGQGKPNSDCITRAYHPAPDFVTTPYSTTSAYSITNFSTPYSGGPFLIKKAYDNHAAIAFHTIRNARTMIYKLHFYPTTGMPSAYLPIAQTTCPWVDPYDPTQWRLFEMVFNSSTNTMYLLENGRHEPTGIFQRWLLPFSMASAETHINGIFLHRGSQVSLDMGIAHNIPIASGISPSTSACYYTAIPPSTNHCQIAYEIPVNDAEIRVEEKTFTFIPGTITPIPISQSPTILTIINIIDCE